MGKLLFWVVVILAGMIVARVLNYQKRNRARQEAADPARTVRHKAEVMVPCGHCGVYQPESQALRRDGEYWCSTDHARKGKPGRR